MTTLDSAKMLPPRPPSPVRVPLRVLLTAGVGSSVALHAHMAASGTHGAATSLVMMAMAIACLSCLVGLLRSGTSEGAVRMTMGMALAMSLGHVLMLPLISEGTHAHHGTAHTAVAAQGSGHGAMLSVVVLELAVAALAVTWLRSTRQDKESSAEITSSPGYVAS